MNAIEGITTKMSPVMDPYKKELTSYEMKSLLFPVKNPYKKTPTQYEKLCLSQIERGNVNKMLAFNRRELRRLESEPEVKDYIQACNVVGSGNVQQYLSTSQDTKKLEKQLITIKLENDNGIQELFHSPDKPDIEILIKLFKSISNGTFYKNLILPTYNKSFNLLTDKIDIDNSTAVLLYSNNYDVDLSYIIHNETDIFDSINTWYIVLFSDVKNIINDLHFPLLCLCPLKLSVLV
jgi:hypothetical protein